MQADRFTQKSLEAINSLQKTAMDFGNQEIEQEHLLYVLLNQENSLILQMIEKMGIDANLFRNEVEAAINKRVKVQGGQPYVGQYLNYTLNYAESEAKKMGDEYVSVEHLFLSMLRHPSPSMKELFRQN
ncbi:MAG: Clp protease N-terminal domain-containing protein, partial [Bilifractor sp.]|nr:Clp protease N-terminal domain-containing protein [Bilifractor sp.]